MKADTGPNEANVYYELDQLLSRLGWTASRQIDLPDWRSDLLAVDSQGTLLCIEVQLGSHPLHSRIITRLTAAHSYVSRTWPGRSFVALLATNPISERLMSAVSTTGVLYVRIADPDNLEDPINSLLSLLSARPGLADSVDRAGMNLMNRAALAMSGNRLDEARSLHTKILQNQIELLGETHPIVFETKSRLARLSVLAGNIHEAAREYSNLLAEQTGVLGADHPSTQETRSTRDALLAELDRSAAGATDTPGYLGAVFDSEGGACGTCFQVAPGVMVTAWHVLDSAGAGSAEAHVRVHPLATGTDLSCTVARVD